MAFILRVKSKALLKVPFICPALICHSPLFFIADASFITHLPSVLFHLGRALMLFMAAYSTLVLWVWFICWHVSLISIRVNIDPHSQVAQPKEIVCNISRALPLTPPLLWSSLVRTASHHHNDTEPLPELKMKHFQETTPVAYYIALITIRILEDKQCYEV